MPENEPLRVLHVVTQMTRGGIETMLMNYDRHIDHNVLQFDFLEHRDAVTDYDKEILALGGRIHRLPRLNPFNPGYLHALDCFFREHPEYRIVHSHLDCMAGIPLKYAKKNGVPVRIAHAHSSSEEKNMKYPIKLACKQIIPKYATRLFACGQRAGQWMFGSRPFFVLNNAIDTSKYTFNEQTRAKMRTELEISPNTLVLGHVGRFSQPKNHAFLIDLFAAMLKIHNDSLLLLVGTGGLEGEIREKCKQLGLEDRVRFLGVRSDVNRLLQAMDVFVLPSLWEGLGIVAVEAQTAGLPCIISENVPEDCMVADGLVTCLPLYAGEEAWAEATLRAAETQRKDTSAQIIASGFDIEENARMLQNIYLELNAQI